MSIEYIITGLYLSDIVINFNTAVYIKGAISFNRRDIIIDYMKF